MVDYQVPLPGLARDFNTLTKEEEDFIKYFSTIDIHCISPVVDCYAGIGPQGYSTSLILARIVKIKERILSDRQLARVLKQNDLYRFVTKDIQPAHNTFNTLRRRLGTKGFIEIHKRFVLKANNLGLLDPDIKELPKNRRKGIIVVADSTFLITSGSTRGQKDEKGQWHFNDESAAFSGKGHHSHKYAVGHKAHSLRTISGVPLVTLLSSANESDQTFIVPLVEELVARYQNLTFSYIILDKGYDTEETHHDIYEFFGIIPIIIRKKIVYPKGFTEDGYPFCPWGFTMKPRGIEYKQRRTKYACFKVCKKSGQSLLFSCDYIKEHYKYGYSQHTYFSNGYRKYGPAVSHSLIYKKLKPFRTGIERTFGLVKENRYRMEMSNFYKGIDNVTIHAIEHDIVLTQDIIFDYIKTGKISPVLNLNY
ncbi:MAG: transposase [Thermodesulfovibrionia bacterium]|nr:transposase [Thermodesulfovibrionia bacterium]